MNNYLNQTKAEMSHVTWPSRGQVITFTILVIVLSLAISLFLGFFDGIFRYALEALLLK